MVNFSQYTVQSVPDIAKELNTSLENGVSSENAKNLLNKFGPNSTQISKNHWTILLARQFKSAFIYLLIAAAVIAFVLGETIDASMIILFVAINVLLGFYQEFKSEQTLKLLEKFIVKKAHVVRDGKEHVIDSTQLVPGDIVMIQTGDIVPADIRLVEEDNILIDESTLTGESVQVTKQITQLSEQVTQTYKAKNIVFAGTNVVEGIAKGIVISTGKLTEFGNIASLTAETEETSSFEKQINKFSKFILILTITTLLVVFVTHLFMKQTVSVAELTIFSIALAVGVIPEAMPLVTTFSLSLGAAALAKKHVVVKRLTAIEDLGGVQVLCTDKTGTITQNILTVSDIYANDKNSALLYGLIGSDFIGKDKTANNSFDLALIAKSSEIIKNEAQTAQKLFEIPFNPNRRRNSVLISMKDKKELVVRGAVEAVMPYVNKLSEKEKEATINWTLGQGVSGKRVIAIAKKAFSKEEYSVQEEQMELELVGLISFDDPIKESTIPAVIKAKKCGIIIKILTGDDEKVAGTVAHTAGIAEKSTDVITGEEFFALDHAEQHKVLENINVFARVSPEQKYNLIQLLQKKYAVGYLGDGINDAPALKVAGVAIVVDTAADVSREVADIVLLKNDLKVIIDGIELGRKTFINVTNYIKATLASNFGNFYAMAFATLLIDYLPMLPIQILLVNLLSDFPMISIATDNVESKELQNPKGYDVKEIILIATILGLVSTSFDFIMFGIFRSGGAQTLQTYWFIGSILTELVLIYSIRNKNWLFKSKSLPSKQILALTGLAAIFTIGIPFTKIGTEVFKFIVPSSSNLIILGVIVVGYLVSTEVIKRVYYTHLSN